MVQTCCRQFWRTATFKVDADLISKIIEIKIEETLRGTVEIPSAMFGINFQIFKKSHLAYSATRGGNAFGINPEDGSLFCKVISDCLIQSTFFYCD